MITDREFALIELDEAETARYLNDPDFQIAVRKAAVDLSDETDRTVLIYDCNGAQIDAISA